MSHLHDMQSFKPYTVNITFIGEFGEYTLWKTDVRKLVNHRDPSHHLLAQNWNL